MRSFQSWSSDKLDLIPILLWHTSANLVIFVFLFLRGSNSSKTNQFMKLKKRSCDITSSTGAIQEPLVATPQICFLRCCHRSLGENQWRTILILFSICSPELSRSVFSQGLLDGTPEGEEFVNCTLEKKECSRPWPSELLCNNPNGCRSRRVWQGGIITATEWWTNNFRPNNELETIWMHQTEYFVHLSASVRGRNKKKKVINQVKESSLKVIRRHKDSKYKCQQCEKRQER